MFPAVGRVADQALAAGIDDKTEVFEGDLSDQDRNIVRRLGDVQDARPALDRQPDGAVDTGIAVAVGRLRAAGIELDEAELFNERPWHGQQSGPGIDECPVDFHFPDLLGWHLPAFHGEQIGQIFDFRFGEGLAHSVLPHQSLSWTAITRPLTQLGSQGFV
jgi:hypothetical protein